MAHTEHFYVSSKGEVKKTTKPSREYFREKNSEAKYIIEVFGHNQESVANQVKNMVDTAGMEDKLFTIRVETR